MYDLISILQSAATSSATFKIDEVQLVSASRNEYKFFPCDMKTYWLAPCMTFEIPTTGGSQIGTVTEVDNNVSFNATFEGTLVQFKKSFLISGGTFVHGTLPMAEIEINEIGFDDQCIMPVVYFQEIYTEAIQSIESANEFIGENLRIYFMNDYMNDNSMLTSDHYSLIINQMKNYALFFLENLKEDKRVNKEYIEDNIQKIVKRVKTGEYIKGGNVVATFGRNLSGVELNMSVAVKQDIRCGGC